MSHMDAVQGEATAFFENLEQVKGKPFAVLVEALFHLRQLASISGNDSIPAPIRHALTVTISGRVAVTLATLSGIADDKNFSEAVHLAKTFDAMADNMLDQLPADEKDEELRASIERMARRMNGTN